MSNGPPAPLDACPQETAKSSEQTARDDDGAAVNADEVTTPSGSVGCKSARVGSLLGPYLITREIARGGSGVIFEAEHTRLGRKVALKVLKADATRSPSDVRRFFQEARAANEIRHPNIVDIVDLVERHSPGPPVVYMVMELLIGADLRTRLGTTETLDPHEAVRIIRQVADALGAAHGRRILHRDIKPENIFLVRPDDPRTTGKVKLLDFGAIKAFGGRTPGERTKPGYTLGTPAYMAPEQIMGQTLDERTDIYALGVVLYEMLAGSVPFGRADTTEAQRLAISHPPPPIGEPRPGAPPIPDALQAVAMRCLQKHPSSRFQSIDQLQQALRHSLSAAPRPMPAPASIDAHASVPPSPVPNRPLQELRTGLQTSPTQVVGRGRQFMGSFQGCLKRWPLIWFGALVVLLALALTVWLQPGGTASPQKELPRPVVSHDMVPSSATKRQPSGEQPSASRLARQRPSGQTGPQAPGDQRSPRGAEAASHSAAPAKHPKRVRRASSRLRRRSRAKRRFRRELTPVAPVGAAAKVREPKKPPMVELMPATLDPWDE